MGREAFHPQVPRDHDCELWAQGRRSPFTFGSLANAPHVKEDAW